MIQKGIEAALNSDETSRAMDKKMGLEDYVRLSFNAENPMNVAQNEKRISICCKSSWKLFQDQVCSSSTAMLPATTLSSLRHHQWFTSTLLKPITNLPSPLRKSTSTKLKS